MTYKSISLLRHEFKKNINENKEKFEVNYNKFFISILEIFVIHGFIKRYVVDFQNAKIFIYLKFYKGRSVLTSFKCYNLKSRKNSLSIYYRKNHFNYKKSLLIISTKYGFIDQYQAHKLRCSGLVIAAIN